ncbi:equistatin-like isoform X5 [Haliotis rufescens]|uniref:equistatin-like isoform X5 n=1 Tax=Haliotis rufescens TaxID=6454 RepID=UPI00201F758B|nr:equistatin-like isoform X5 [Haliotis rufescens]
MTLYRDAVCVVFLLSHLAKSRPLLSVPSFNPWIIPMSRSSQGLGLCALRHHEYLDKEQHLLGSSEPLCETDGTFKAKQCRGSGCYCVDTDGNDLGYFTNYAAGTDNMDCTCARDKAAYLKTGLIGKLFFCDNKGSYNKKQCTGSVCFCTDNNGKMLSNGQTVNIGEMDKLQC